MIIYVFIDDLPLWFSRFNRSGKCLYQCIYIYFLYISVYLQYTIVYHLSDKLITIKKKKNINYKPNENAQDNHTGLPV